MADDDKDADAATRTARMTGATAKQKPLPAGKEDVHVSQALRTVYQRAVDEDIPPEMLDLLSKLD
ncbi:NepR family anti-sigma factor [Sphingobium sp. Z007]|uniref:NepR family anti-sigma factor n=1 Tax=Sphingobium sp. Z007 TaxID=627495 RepID=UPI001124E6CC|nr:NepR family anti-sigma factor [Sphingobium sp. Z007]